MSGPHHEDWGIGAGAQRTLKSSYSRSSAVLFASASFARLRSRAALRAGINGGTATMRRKGCKHWSPWRAAARLRRPGIWIGGSIRQADLAQQNSILWLGDDLGGISEKDRPRGGLARGRPALWGRLFATLRSRTIIAALSGAALPPDDNPRQGHDRKQGHRLKSGDEALLVVGLGL